MPALITELIDRRDNVEIVRDQIAAILTVELANQATLSGPTDAAQPRVFLERALPWGEFQAEERTIAPIINVALDSTSYDGSSSNIVERQKCEATFNVDCYGYSASTDDGNPVGGHSPGDYAAVLECQRTVKLARAILMSGHYTYLGLRGLVWKRWTTGITMFQPQSDNRAAFRIVAARLAFQVSFNEFSPQVVAETIETLSVEVYRAPTGELLLSANYPAATEG